MLLSDILRLTSVCLSRTSGVYIDKCEYIVNLWGAKAYCVATRTVRKA